MLNLLKNKLFIIFSFILLISFTFSFSSVFANDTNFTVEDNNRQIVIHIPDTYNYNIILYHVNTDYNKIYIHYFYCNSEMELNPQGSIRTTNSSDLIHHRLVGINFTSENVQNIYLSDFYNESSDGAVTGLGDNDIASFDLFADYTVFDYNREVVFQEAPQTQGELSKVELMKPTQVQEIPQQIVAVVMIVLPIFLGIFGVLLVLYLIRSKNLLQL